MCADKISHIKNEPCANIQSKIHHKLRCKNPATHGAYCGVHHKHPTPWSPTSSDAKATRKLKRVVREDARPEAASNIQRWHRAVCGFHNRRVYGPAFYIRGLATNDTDFFSADNISDISGALFYSYRDSDKHIYAFDIRSIYTLIYRSRTSGDATLNPFTRGPIGQPIIKAVMSIVKRLRKQGVPTEWAPLEPPTPEQQWRMKAVDLFNTIDELNYYSSPEWFIQLTTEGHRKFYSEAHAIWTHRAGLTMSQKNTIVPQFLQKLFRHPPWAMRDQSLETMQKINMNTIRLFVTSAEDRNDRILGAMYVVSALTLVSAQARIAYPWLYESVYVPTLSPVMELLEDGRRYSLGNLLGVNWIHELLAHNDPLPPLQLPPPAASD